MTTHVWRETLMANWQAADDAWHAAREAACNGWSTEMAEWTADHPRPRLGDFMVALSYGEEAAA
jgi:hypothetical protein